MCSMSEPDDISLETDDIMDVDEPRLSSEIVSPKKSGTAWGRVFLLFILASLLGALGGWAATHYVPIKKEVFKSSVDFTAIVERIAENEKTLTSQKAQLSRLQNTLESLPKHDGSQTDNVDIDATQLDQLNGEISALNEKLQALKGEMESQFVDLKSVSNSSPSISENPIESPDETLPADKLSEPSETVLAFQADLNALQERVVTLEAGLVETRALAVEPTIIKDPVILPPFPREAVFKALTEMPVSEGQGWFSKRLKEHISVRDPEQMKNAEETLQAIERAIEISDIEGALTLVQALPDAPRDKASDWISAVQRDKSKIE